LQEEVAELVLEVGPGAALDGVEDLVGLFEGVALDGVEGLLAVPGAAAGGARRAMMAAARWRASAAGAWACSPSIGSRGIHGLSLRESGVLGSTAKRRRTH
jgi:hypothetical protein